MVSLKQKTVSGLFWSFVDSIANEGIRFIIGIILARILSPHEFGLIGMVTVFIAISQSFIDSGFGNALIRKKECTPEDYSTVFYFNMIIGILFYVVLFLSAPAISLFFNEPGLKAIIQVLGTVLIINSFTIIQSTIRTKRMDFKLQARISVIASIVSGIVAITMALSGFGIWSLVALQISRQALNSIFLWIWNGWKPILVFSKTSLKELFGFGSKLLLSGLIDTLYRNVYNLVIGKYFSATELGFYTRADQFKNLPTQNLYSVIGRVTYPVLSSIQDDIPRLRQSYQKIIRSTMLITFVLMLGLAAVSEPMIISFIGEKWRPSIVYLQMLCFVGMMYPIHALNLNMLQVLGRSDLFLKLEVIKKILVIPVIIAGVFWGIKIMIAGMLINTLIAYYLNSYWSGRFISYSIKEQLMDILPSFFLALSSSFIVYLIGRFLPFDNLLKLIIQVFSGALLVLILCELTKLNSYTLIKETVVDKIKEIRNGQN